MHKFDLFCKAATDNVSIMGHKHIFSKNNIARIYSSTLQEPETTKHGFEIQFLYCNIDLNF